MEYDRENRNCQDHCCMNDGDWCERVYIRLERWLDLMCISRDMEQQIESIDNFMDENEYVESGSEVEEYIFIEIRNRLSGIYNLVEYLLDKKEKQLAEILHKIVLNETAGERLFCSREEYAHAFALWEAGKFMEDLKEIIAVSDQKCSAEDILKELSEYHA